MHTPSLEEVRRHWGLAVDIHRREERLDQFDRMIKSYVESYVESVTESVLDQEVDTISLSGKVYILSDDVSKLLKGIIENV